MNYQVSIKLIGITIEVEEDQIILDDAFATHDGLVVIAVDVPDEVEIQSRSLDKLFKYIIFNIELVTDIDSPSSTKVDYRHAFA